MSFSQTNYTLRLIICLLISLNFPLPFPGQFDIFILSQWMNDNWVTLYQSYDLVSGFPIQPIILRCIWSEVQTTTDLPLRYYSLWTADCILHHSMNSPSKRGSKLGNMCLQQCHKGYCWQRVISPEYTVSPHSFKVKTCGVSITVNMLKS